MTSAWHIVDGDCIEAMAAMPPESIDAVVCDPPYGLEFMGKDWDSFRVDERTARWAGDKSGSGGGRITGADEVKEEHSAFGRVAFSSRRTTSRCRTCGKRDAFRNPHACGDGADWTTEWVDSKPVELRAFQNWCEGWAREALRVLKPGGHLLAFGGTRTYHRLACAVEESGFEVRDTIAWMYGSGFPKSHDVSKAIDKAAGAEREVHHTAPVTPEAQAWEGWGTALKPAYEPVVVARKPLAGTVAANVLEHGTGALNIDGCRIDTGGESYAYPNGPRGNSGNGAAFDGTGLGRREEPVESHPAGRWPANVTLDPDAAAMLDEQSGESVANEPRLNRRGATTGASIGGQGRYGVAGPHEAVTGYGDAGGASRFFYCAKASTAERNAGLNDEQGRNVHPTVKPIELMRWLVRLVTPPGGTVLDPFTGSGTTGCAAVLEGVRFVGCERDPDYTAIARARIAWWEQHPDGIEFDEALKADAQRRAIRDAGQASIFDLEDDAA